MDTLKHCLHFTAQKMKAQREYPFSVLAMTNQHKFSSFSQFSRSVMYDTLWPMDCSTPDFLVHHKLQEVTQTHVHRVSDAIQPSHSLSSPSLPTFNLSQPSGSFPTSQLFTSGGHSIRDSGSASVLLMNIQGWFPLRLTGLVSLLSKRVSRVFPAPQFKSITSLALSCL